MGREATQFKPGNPGRRKGAKGKLTKFKEDMMKAYNKKGGVKYFYRSQKITRWSL